MFEFHSDFSASNNFGLFFRLSTVDKTKPIITINNIQANKDLLPQLGGFPADVRELHSGDLFAVTQNKAPK